MSHQQSLDPQQIVRMEVLQMPIVELSTRLRALAVDYPSISFSKSSTRSVSYDATIRSGEFRYILEISEPSTGTASIEHDSDEVSIGARDAAWFVESIAVRRLLLYRLTEQLMECFPEIPARGVYGTIGILDLAARCELPVTTVSRILVGKKLKTDSGLILYRDFCDDSTAR